MVGSQIVRQRISLDHMSLRETITITSIVRHKTKTVFPNTSLLVVHVVDNLIYNSGCLIHRTDRETADADVYFFICYVFIIINIIQEAKIIIYHV